MMSRNTTVSWNGVKVFSSTKAREREDMGEKVTAWIRQHRDIVIKDKIVTQSSDNEFHCLTVTLFYDEEYPRRTRRKKGA